MISDKLVICLIGYKIYREKGGCFILGRGEVVVEKILLCLKKYLNNSTCVEKNEA